jgi:hypothetical protein
MPGQSQGVSSSGTVTITSTAGRITYFDGFTRVADSGKATITTAQNLQAANTQFAIADPQGRIVMTNPSTGRIGTMGRNWIEGPGQYGLDANLVKRVRIGETKEFELRLDAINLLNHGNFPNPTVTKLRRKLNRAILQMIRHPFKAALIRFKDHRVRTGHEIV